MSTVSMRIDESLVGAARVAAGEFDASEAESEEWARSQTDPQIIAMILVGIVFGPVLHPGDQSPMGLRCAV